MLKNKSLHRPDRQLEKMLISLVYTLIAMALNILLLFIFPHHSLWFLASTLILTSAAISLAIVIISDSERALTYGGFANVLLDDQNIIKRIDNTDFDPVIENKPAASFFDCKSVLPFLKKHIFHDIQNKLNIERLEQALQDLRAENVLLELSLEKQARWFKVSLRPLYLKKNDIFESDFSVEEIQKETYFFWQIEDVTAAQNMEKILEQERLKLHNFIEDMPLGLYITDCKNNIEYVNNTFAHQLEMQKSQLINKPLTDFVPDKESRLFDQSLIESSLLCFFENEKQVVHPD